MAASMVELAVTACQYIDDVTYKSGARSPSRGEAVLARRLEGTRHIQHIQHIPKVNLNNTQYIQCGFVTGLFTPHKR